MSGKVVEAGELAEALGVTTRTVARWADEGRIPYARVCATGPRRYEPARVLAALLASGAEVTDELRKLAGEPAAA